MRVQTAAIAPFVFGHPFLACFAPLLGVFAYAWKNNRMMAYVEERLFGGGR